MSRGRRPADGGSARSDRARRRLRHVGRSGSSWRRSAEALGALSAPHGVFGILGNHDDDHDMPAALVARGVQMLKDARTRLTIRDEPLELVGLRFWTKRASDIAAVLRGATGHGHAARARPAAADRSRGADVPLVLSGHTHGGQVVLPVVGAVAARKFPVVAGRRAAGTARRSSSAAASGRSTCRCESTARPKSRC